MTATAETILASLSTLGARIERRGERLMLYSDGRPIPKPLVEAARDAKADLLALLDAESAREPVKTAKIALAGGVNPDPRKTSGFLPTSIKAASNKNYGGLNPGDAPDEAAEPRNRDLRVPLSDAEQERAAIAEYDGVIPRAWAEGFARLDRARPPAVVPLRRWQTFIDDVGRFLDEWARTAIKLGWGSCDLFGCDRDRPVARIDRAGLLWLLDGNRLAALSENTATIETRTRARRTYNRRLGEPGRVLAWELEPWGA